MASLIRLKQIESGSSLQANADLGSSFSQSVINIVQNEVVGFLPPGVVSGSSQLDGTTINNLTIATQSDAYSLIVSGALAVVDADITIDSSQYNVAGQIWVNGETGSLGNPPDLPYDNQGNPQSDIIDQGEW
jgi:hypothetical protein